MGIRSRFRDWRAERRADKRRFPVQWFTYKRRVRDEVERLFKSEGGHEFFSDKFIEAMAENARRLEQWELKLFTYHLAIFAFVVLGLMSGDPSLTVFGVSFKSATGLKEFLLALSATLAILINVVSTSKQVRWAVLEKLTELKTDQKFVDVAKLATPAPFNLTVYIPKEYDRWIFPTLFPSLSFNTLFLLLSVWGLVLFAFTTFISAYVVVQIWNAPTLGTWSYIVIAYALLAYAICLLWLTHAILPLRYRDNQRLKEILALKETDLAAYNAQIAEFYRT